jgi:hypothetical protein
VVKDGEGPAPHPIKTAPTPSEGHDKFEDNLGTTEEDIRKQEETPIWRIWVGAFIGWVQKWKTLANVHMRSMVLVALIAATVWSIGLVYGAARFGASGFAALIGATIIAIISASIAVLFLLVPGEYKTIGLAYPSLLNVILLPPLIVAYYEPVLSFVWDYSSLVTIWILDTWLHYGDINTYLRQNFTMTNQLYIAMWFFISYPVGWGVGTSVYTAKEHGPKLIDSIQRLFIQRRAPHRTSPDSRGDVPDNQESEEPNSTEE